MGDILDELRSPSFPMGQRFALCQEAADEIERLRADYADMVDRADAWASTALDFDDDLDRWTLRAERAEADADRLAEALRNMAEHELNASACRLCILLDLHEREVEAR